MSHSAEDVDSIVPSGFSSEDDLDDSMDTTDRALASKYKNVSNLFALCLGSLTLSYHTSESSDSEAAATT